VRIPWACYEVEEWHHGLRKAKDFELVSQELGAQRFQEGSRQLRLLCASIGPDPHGKRVEAFLNAANRAEAPVALMKARYGEEAQGTGGAARGGEG
ncbi:unnamed protein product, partial [Durusdinium trenchii]